MRAVKPGLDRAQRPMGKNPARTSLSRKMSRMVLTRTGSAPSSKVDSTLGVGLLQVFSALVASKARTGAAGIATKAIDATNVTHDQRRARPAPCRTIPTPRFRLFDVRSIRQRTASLVGRDATGAVRALPLAGRQ